VSEPQGSGTRDGVITVDSVDAGYGSVQILHQVSMTARTGEVTCVFGPNGCGKSTLINMIAGLIPLDAGQVLFDGMLLSEIKFGYVFQNYREALFPWLRAFDNIAYPLKMKGVDKAARNAQVEKLVARLLAKRADDRAARRSGTR